MLRIASSAVLGAVIAGILAALAASDCPQPGVDLRMFGVFLFAAAAISVVVLVGLFALFARNRLVAGLMFAFAVGVLAGTIVGAAVGDGLPSRCPPPTSVGGQLTFTVSSDSLDLAATGEGTCDISTVYPGVGTIGGRAVIDGGAREFLFFSLPISPTSPDLGFVDFEVLDGDRGWGYRSTEAGQVVVQRTTDLSGTTRLLGVPLLEETRPAGAPVPEELDATIEWSCVLDPAV